MNRRLREVFAALRDLARAPGTFRAINGLVATVTTLNPTLRFVGPYQTVCNYWNYFWTYVAEHFSEPDQTGQTQRALLNSTAGQTNGIAQGSAYEPANGVGYPENPNDPRRQRGDLEILHGQGYGGAINNDGTADCENGQRGYLRGPLAIFSAPRDLNGFPTRVVFNSHTPGSQGPTFTGRARVPAGQTFTRENQTGAQLPIELTTGVFGG
jgi:hypothetical protein